ncbi:MAG: UDP-N-acetylmuramoyl-L-alanyl-D-glutamate--2,6-diaminopimelate ligase [Chloroflexi bacterium]|nr:UDP-N-acetylmuramoyl-L-alanyl-D-glutamate--2,6-diaminopimelate ligase [Chloroflexota bacterium]
MPSLAQLLSGHPTLSPVPDIPISGVQVDSRLVQPGDLFVAVIDTVDRYKFIDQVVARGAAAVLGEKESVELRIPHIRVADDRAALAHAAAMFHGQPARDLTLLGVTGTDGKTTTSNFLYHILQAAGLKAGIVTTVNALIGAEVLDTGFHVTTPEAMDAQGYLRRMADAGLTHAVLEMTSHGLAQQRGARACEFDIAVVTNITHEHLDYHGSYDEYLAAKARLFEGLSEPFEKTHPIERLAVLNRDDRSYEPLRARTAARQAVYGLSADADVRAVDIQNAPEALRFTAVGPGFQMPVETRMFGNYNVYNALAAISASVVGLGVAPEAAAEGIRALAGVPGRMERIDLGQDFTAIVDFAHTPFALQAALEAGRRITRGKVIAVFGSAGLRDKAKRRMMAETSIELADYTVLTAEDPRTESLDGILAEMAAGAEAKGGVEGKTFWRVPDRGEAIRFALTLAQPGDLVMALGKGHEQSMCFIETEYAWDDRTAMRAALSEYLGLAGPPMPALPTQE